LALVPGGLSPSLAEGAVRLGTWLPFAPAASFLELFTRTEVSEATLRRLTERAGAAYEAVQAAEVERLERACPPPPVGPALQQLSVDGAMVPLRGRGEWAEVKTLAVGTVVGTAATVATPPVVAPPQEVPREPHATGLSYFSRLAEHTTFCRLATAETYRRGTETAGVVCGVTDGAEWCQTFLDVHRPDAVRILDFAHAAGYLAQLAAALHGEGTPAAAAWLEAQRHALRHDDTPDAVLAAAAAARDALVVRGAPAETLALAATAVAYLEKRRDQLRYTLFARLGYPIGSGIVESANKLVVEARMKGAGMHWARPHVNPMLALRGAACSDRWAEAWPLLATRLRADRRARHRRAARRPCAPAPPAAALPVPPPAPAAVAAPPARGPATDHPWRRLPAGVGRVTRVRFYRGRHDAK
jgi:hypothetical protein